MSLEIQERTGMRESHILLCVFGASLKAPGKGNEMTWPNVSKEYLHQGKTEINQEQKKDYCDN